MSSALTPVALVAVSLVSVPVAGGEAPGAAAAALGHRAAAAGHGEAAPAHGEAVAAARADTTVRSTPGARRALQLTLYSQGFGMVTDVRRSALPGGRVALDFGGVAPRLQESTVRLASSAGSGRLRTLEQSFRWEPLTPERLLRAHVGETVRVHPRDRAGVEAAPVDAELLSVEDGRVLRMNGRVTFGVDGRLSFPAVPPRLMDPPILSWELDVREPAEEISVSYLTDGLGWSADYVLILGPDGGAPASLTGWVQLQNGSGADWPDARIRLVAGEVQRASGGGPRAAMAMMEDARAAAPGVSRGELFAYHRYDLEREVTLPDGASKRVSLLQAGGVEVARRYEVRGSSGIFRNRGGGTGDEPVQVVLELANREDRGLGMPLPAGVVRVYAAAGEGPGAFLGEDRIGHTPEGETVEVVPGLAFDLTAERVQTDYQALGRCSSESAWEIRLRNARQEPADVRVLEPVSGEWEVLQSSHPYEEVSAGTLRFDVEVSGEGSETVSYRVRVSWC